MEGSLLLGSDSFWALSQAFEALLALSQAFAGAEGPATPNPARKSSMSASDSCWEAASSSSDSVSCQSSMDTSFGFFPSDAALKNSSSAPWTPFKALATFSACASVVVLVEQPVIAWFPLLPIFISSSTFKNW